MKKIILLSAFFVGAVSFSFAQTVSFGLKAGANFSKLNMSDLDGSISTQSLTGFHVGGVADVGFGSVSVQPGLLFSTMGGKFSFSATDDAGNTMTSVSKITLNYLQVPINVLYKVPAGSGKVFFGAGPYLGYGLSGKSTNILTMTGQPTQQDSENLTFGSGEDDVKRMDLGLNFLAGYQLNKGLSLSVNYGLGLANLDNNNTDNSGNNTTTKNQVISVSLGYFFK